MYRCEGVGWDGGWIVRNNENVFYEMDEQEAEHAFPLKKCHKTVVLTRSGKPGVNFLSFA
jgi:hypothetical protein